ncbi:MULTISPECIES: hypothetical protein [Enterococcus]|uniref:hypothetical protein n=1 Tax=Enterococcus TaxID=1350 RepID=UPI002303F415|nr:hypothetical protein [Enterococcus mundtii]MDA9429945.1 hypothetical protein [Enterococcus mundtii 1A]
MEMLDKLNQLKETLNSSPENLKKFMEEYEQYRNKVIYDQIKSQDEDSITIHTSFYYFSDNKSSNIKKASSLYGNKKVDVSVNTYESSNEYVITSRIKLAA